MQTRRRVPVVSGIFSGRIDGNFIHYSSGGNWVVEATLTEPLPILETLTITEGKGEFKKQGNVMTASLKITVEWKWEEQL